jgi:hypothetical protein
MEIRGLIDEDFINYKKPSMVIMMPNCRGWKCGKELCQNSPMAKSAIATVDAEYLAQRYSTNPISEAIVFSGLEPFDDFWQMYDAIGKFRDVTKDPIIIYTGYVPSEILEELDALIDSYENVIVKFGRYVPNKPSYLNQVLGVNLASPNQYAEQIS